MTRYEWIKNKNKKANIDSLSYSKKGVGSSIDLQIHANINYISWSITYKSIDLYVIDQEM